MPQFLLSSPLPSLPLPSFPLTSLLLPTIPLCPSPCPSLLQSCPPSLPLCVLLGWWGSTEPSGLHARQDPYPLCYCFSPCVAVSLSTCSDSIGVKEIKISDINASLLVNSSQQPVHAHSPVRRHGKGCFRTGSQKCN